MRAAMRGTAAVQPKRKKSAEDLRDERLRAVRVRVRHNDGRAEIVSAFAAARLLREGSAEPCGTWTDAELYAVVEAVEARERRQIGALARDGLLVGAEEATRWR